VQRADSALRGGGVETPWDAVGLWRAEAGSEGGQRVVQSFE
jgi:hypothetical protein